MINEIELILGSEMSELIIEHLLMSLLETCLSDI